ncbi:hypothetical protein VTI74DRAFT_8251 [Chaetomium olivicolor]
MTNPLPSVCAVTSFLWLANSLEDHQIIEQPRLSFFLVLLIGALATYAVSFFATWLPGTHGRFDDELGLLKVSRTNLPKKPRRYFLPILVICVILRHEIFHRVTFDLQCSKAGVEAFLPLFIALYELLPGRRTRSRSGEDPDKDPDDPGMTRFDVLGDWFNESKTSLSLGVVMLSWGAYLAASNEPKSTFFCSSHDREGLIVSLQWASLVLDATIAIVLWRILAWCRTTKSRLRTLSGTLLVSSLGAALLYWGSRLVLPARPVSYHFRGLDSLYFFDVVVDGLAFSTFIISASLLATEGSPLSLVGTITFLSGLVLAVQKMRLAGTWANVTPAANYVGLLLICVGFSSFVYANNIQSVVFVHRAFVVWLLVLLTIFAAIYTPIKALQVVDQHPLERIIYDARIGADRWLVHATVSDSLPVAVQEYKDRHKGRNPPPKFDIWYNFAKDKRSPILDHFPQMATDLLPFWGISPSKIREGTRRAAAEPDIALLQIQDGKPQHNLPPGSAYKLVMDDLVDRIKGFAEHLPNMELAVNLDERPRVLAPWNNVRRAIKSANRNRVSKLLPSVSKSLAEMPVAQPAASDKLKVQDTFTPVRALREMTALTCPPGTKARAGTHWDIRDVCLSCLGPHSDGQFLTHWAVSQNICHQSDLLRLHSFHMTPPELRPLQELLPVFSRSKTDSYSDILIPLRHITEPIQPTTDGFNLKWKKLFWRGKVDRLGTSHELARGGHQERLVHLINNPIASEKTTMLLPENNQFAFEQVPTAELNELLPIDVGFTSYTPCKTAAGDSGCGSDPTTSDFQQKKKAEEADPLRNQYVMVVDTDNGPPREFLRTLRAKSVPVLATIFIEWYTDRLLPWVHFAPVDLRYHALHSTMAYFFGMQKKEGHTLNGRDVEFEGRRDDGKWIAEEGARWAAKALRKEDEEVYLFRLLLEWGRIVDDNRDGIGFVLP